MKGNKMPIKITPIKKKKSPPKTPARRKTPKGGGPFITPGQKNKLDQMTGKAKPLEANIGGILSKTKKMLGNFKKNKKPTMAKNTKAKDNVKTAKNGGVIKANMGKLLETFSPAYSMMKGKGPVSSILSAVGGSGLGGPASIFAKQQRDKAKKRRMEMSGEKENTNRMTPATPAAGMKKGGSLKKKKSIDGIASKGKTRGV